MLATREASIVEGETTLKIRTREIQEREQRLQVALSKAAKAEQDAGAFEETLKLQEAVLRKREHEHALKDR